MGSTGGTEACGRCGFSTVVDAVEGADDADAAEVDGDAAEAGGATAEAPASGTADPEAPSAPDTRSDERYDPFDGAYIEVDETDLRLVSAPAVAAGRVKRRLDEAARRLIWGR